MRKVHKRIFKSVETFSVQQIWLFLVNELGPVAVYVFPKT